VTQPHATALVVAAVAGLSLATPGAQSTALRAWVTFPSGIKVSVEIANTEAARARGLMFRKTLAQDQGMIFLFEEPGVHSFWMKNTLIPLDILWLDRSGRIVSIAHAVPPCTVDPCPSYAPTAESCAVLEVVSGFAKQHRVGVGDRIRIDQAASPSSCRDRELLKKLPPDRL
jgi:uncharacterized protein